ncbi:potassium channel family protein [Guptibacillus algicola]|uniref:potassium channel family protein n=1 Tax=Guptibacillus algicola TaxID=225844 RepID=UPI001CD48FA3|nr:TrkA family potassium uptake protein [Alkalihalobacillus algicola]MCA0988339.1 TrkA family potassium uptake protein [Alkalihalobacillus algicola]
MRKQFLVLGAGRFAKGIIQELYAQKCDVIVCDKDEGPLEDIEEYATHSIVGDLRENGVMDDLNVEQFDAVFVAIGTDSYSAILITNRLRERNAKEIIVKATSKEIGEILSNLGANRVIYPEEEAGMKVARQITMPNVIEYIEITKNVSAVELKVPEELVGKTLLELDFSRKYDLNVSLILREDSPILSRYAEVAFQSDDVILIVGENKKIQQFRKKFDL